MIRDEDAPSSGPQPATGRYEFRTWPRETPQAAAILQKSWPLVGGERRSDIYLLTERSTERLVKLRAGNRLEVKRRGRDLGPLQYWTHQSFPLFPLPRPAMMGLSDVLGLPLLDREAGMSPGHLVARLGELAPAVLPVTVRKSRLLFRKASTRVEICHVAVAGWTRLTLALEDPDPESARAALEGLGLDHSPNRSYGDMLGRRRLPAMSGTPVS
ncbi:hypothetical protein V8324_12425 [Roseovarius sp. D22-M7]